VFNEEMMNDDNAWRWIGFGTVNRRSEIIIIHDDQGMNGRQINSAAYSPLQQRTDMRTQ
jgi:hypothetical protein